MPYVPINQRVRRIVERAMHARLDSALLNEQAPRDEPLLLLQCAPLTLCVRKSVFHALLDLADQGAFAIAADGSLAPPATPGTYRWRRHPDNAYAYAVVAQ